MGGAGALAGAFSFALLYIADVPIIVGLAWLSLVTLTLYGAISGMLIGGLVGLPPDNDAPARTVFNDADDAGAAAVILHLRNAEQCGKANAMLAASGGHSIKMK